MSTWLIDTNVLLRSADVRSPEQRVASAAIAHLLKSGGNTLHISIQVLVEFWAVATRPESVNGLGWPAPTAAPSIAGSNL